MKDTAEYDPVIADRGGEQVVVDRETRDELVVVGPSLANDTNSNARFHSPSIEAVSDADSACDSVVKDPRGWQWMAIGMVPDRTPECRYCGGDADRAEHSGKSNSGLLERAIAMDPEEFDRRAGIETPDSEREQA